MVRIKRGDVARKRRKKMLSHTKGFKISNSKLFRVAHQQCLKSLSYLYIGRKLRKRDFRRLWIMRINCTLRKEGKNYSKFISTLKKSNIGLNRKMLAELVFIKNDLYHLHDFSEIF